MSLEAKVNALDYAFQENNKILEATQGVVSLILNEQRDKFKEVDRRLDAVDHRLDAVDRRFDAVDHRLDAIDRRFDKTEELLIQIVNHLASK
ncbi:hypothetical protein [Endozoicomonas sp. GU-1]|uniref:hypothetical protein n=1 Tax=Endozoicomonas sp. GU-1 TaxID=3009078 RepID=UPI0022B31A5C|nr:hypothetical protein [Endozoicomonas sp. GU-1]WBA81886.1 hypothetical protein O2T12_01555 [Endozoicomonas sp. GU-1]WBA84839.1 hypothetical protein O3276_16350 [Endozoicomonas sp. GU-1]